MKFKDLMGLRFERLLVVKRSTSDNRGHAYWLVRCDCGKEFVVKSQSLTAGNTKSCGCFKKESVIANNKKRSLPFGESSFNMLFKNYKDASKRRAIIFELSERLFRDLVKQNCFYCGSEPLQKIALSGRNGSYTYNGIDRRDSNAGYTFENSVPCCGVCNWMKRTASVEEFIQACQKVSDYQVKRLEESRRIKQ